MAVLSVVVSALALCAAVGVFYVTRRQVDEAVRQTGVARSALPRSWIYVEFPALPSSRATNSGAVANAGSSFSITVPITLRNYGQLPATITWLNATMYVQQPGVAAARMSPFDGFGKVADGVSASADFQPEWGKYTGHVVASGGGFPLSDSLFKFDTSGSAIVPSGSLRQWIYVLVRYEDPFGKFRHTGFLGRVDGSSMVAIDDERYTNQR